MQQYHLPLNIRYVGYSEYQLGYIDSFFCMAQSRRLLSCNPVATELKQLEEGIKSLNGACFFFRRYAKCCFLQAAGWKRGGGIPSVPPQNHPWEGSATRVRSRPSHLGQGRENSCTGRTRWPRGKPFLVHRAVFRSSEKRLDEGHFGQLMPHSHQLNMFT